MTAPRKADIILACSKQGHVHLIVTAEGKQEELIITRTAAASLIDRLARALAG